MTVILQDALPEDAISHALPGTRPLAHGDWLRRDERYAEQMALRDRLVAEKRDAVIGMRPEGEAPARELLSIIAAELGASGTEYARPDGVRVTLDADDPLGTLGRLCQEDFAIMVAGEAEHWLAAGVVCFPSRWTLAQKIGRPLTRIHKPVKVYDNGLARRVQRLFDAAHPDRSIVRWNRLPYWDTKLFNPQLEPKYDGPFAPEGERSFIRAERQVIRRLPETGAVVFSIHTWLVKASAVQAPARSA
ncbi:DUF3445 domain-containing protein [Pseudoruegeria sp. HB172150]|uniref:heme-dependent oxidative N-demethylase family protein n=1 Tax=Pseudoruegeria sp. HB172150 TaxID=2721164 RepID=UPI00155772DB|nr:DUF3445 domain-containing protein [Pseudoruegeria sp. HB172150]